MEGSISGNESQEGNPANFILQRILAILGMMN
jgi:hypothetical protein